MPIINLKELNEKDELYNRIRCKYKVRIDTLKNKYFNNNNINKWCDIPEAWVNDCTEKRENE